ncbi:hypothetical protein [Streptomyces antarcticus]|uniref:hypothetical protein n=1 Tax=Streptomyces antarcticus TaxID=2996458 RepID=UPI0022760AE1|nr:hypothetical protein [Streptomyces sp. H34-S5]MCY0940261.1 hypothetical protein [Streptomyces sp. H34-AA3]
MPSPVVRLLALADQFTQHNDQLARLRPAYGATWGHASAQVLVSACLDAVQAIVDRPMYAGVTLTEATVRIKQLAVLTGQAVRHLAEAKEQLGAPASPSDPPSRGGEVAHQIQLARELTALAPAMALESASAVASEIHRRRPATATENDALTPAERAALHATARGHVVIGRREGREYVHSRDSSVHIDTLRALEHAGLVAVDPGSAPPAFDGGPPHDRVRLTLSGAMAVTAFLGRGPRTPPLSAPRALGAHTTAAPARAR